ncbi:hypothetical protein EVAR_89296_1 [Eumeta japonica]|uniref:Uncharacterized protein n=1 Tax=Eumeta variegata TaxID=151549 RepID=A0A4C1SPR6_EUMVA|nr:hypothetical protein EVAR_89296_1 [Eumeta japonica]
MQRKLWSDVWMPKTGMKCSAVCFHCSGETCSNVMELSELINENDFDDEPPTLTSFSSSPTVFLSNLHGVREKRMHRMRLANFKGKYKMLRYLTFYGCSPRPFPGPLYEKCFTVKSGEAFVTATIHKGGHPGLGDEKEEAGRKRKASEGANNPLLESIVVVQLAQVPMGNEEDHKQALELNGRRARSPNENTEDARSAGGFGRPRTGRDPFHITYAYFSRPAANISAFIAPLQVSRSHSPPLQSRGVRRLFSKYTRLPSYKPTPNNLAPPRPALGGASRPTAGGFVCCLLVIEAKKNIL